MSTHSCARKRCTGALLLMTLQGTACQAWHTEAGTPPVVLATDQPTKLRVTRTDGRELVLQQPVIRGDTLVGIAHHQKEQQEVRIALTDVRQVATRGFSAGRTVALGVGVLGVAAILLAAGACAADGGHMTVSGCAGAN